MKEIKNWIAALDKQIGDTETEINNRRQLNSKAVKMREDLYALIKYMDDNNLPDPVKRAMQSCLSWNPHARNGAYTPNVELTGDPLAERPC